MTERQLQFRVGLFVIVALAVTGVMVFHFGSLKSLWEPRYKMALRFDTAPGVFPATPVRRNGITIGAVTDVVLDDEQGGVLVIVEVRQDVRLREDCEPRLIRTLLGDSSIEFSGGKSPRFLKGGVTLRGEPPADPMELVSRMEERVAVSLETFNAVAREWQKVGKNFNGLVETNRGNMDDIIERTAVALDQFTTTMKKAEVAMVNTSAILGDEENQANMKRTLAEMPALVAQTKEAIAAVQSAVGKADETLGNIKDATEPMAKKSASIFTKLDSTLANLEVVSKDMSSFTQLVMQEDGPAKQFASDPELYRNLNQSAETLSLLLQNMEPILRDARIFSDKIARHPELMGAGGVMRPSNGLKDPVPSGLPTMNNPPARQAVGPERTRLK
ncbi:MAG: MCE family protein [Planctomycetaceae bacterium]|nr:MCE family protein [Planctomycetaceae bacterium]